MLLASLIALLLSGRPATPAPTPAIRPPRRRPRLRRTALASTALTPLCTAARLLQALGSQVLGEATVPPAPLLAELLLRDPATLRVKITHAAPPNVGAAAQDPIHRETASSPRSAPETAHSAARLAARPAYAPPAPDPTHHAPAPALACTAEPAPSRANARQDPMDLKRNNRIGSCSGQRRYSHGRACPGHLYHNPCGIVGRHKAGHDGSLHPVERRTCFVPSPYAP